MSIRKTLEGKDGDKLPVIIYEWRQTTVIRAKGNTGKQGKAAKQQAQLLGLTSNLSARLRHAMKEYLPDPLPKKSIFDLNYGLQQWLRKINTDQPNQPRWVSAQSLLDSKKTIDPDSFQQFSVNRNEEGSYYIRIDPSRMQIINRQIKIDIITIALEPVKDGNTTLSETRIEFNPSEQTSAIIIPIEMELGEGEIGVVGWSTVR